MRVAIIAVCIILIALLSGPLFYFRPTPVAMELPISSPEQVDDYIVQTEGKVAGLRSDLAKYVSWANVTSRQKTKYSVVYLHGFTASRRDISPVVEKLASGLGANAFYTRLKAHGLQGGDEFANVKAVDWWNDAREAFAIGKLIGQQVVLVGTSTGGLLATLLAMDREAQQSIAALILLSPNYGLRNWQARFVSGPLGKYIARRAIGAERVTKASNDGHAYAWTHRYRAEGIVALMDLTNSMQRKKLDDIAIPTLLLYTERDQLLDVDAMRVRFDSIIDKRRQMINIEGATRHELTGDILEPATVGPVLKSIETFLREMVGLQFVGHGAPQTASAN